MNDQSPDSAAVPPREYAVPVREYVVVARRYRPQAFDELIGQEHVAKGLQGAIENNRVGHAYLFTGARGVGKTSAARILAKCLNCDRGTSPTPCGECESCQAITAGSDMDVLEIDGATNNGVDEVREIRQNASVRPSRSRYKIYIIDEVHMLSKSAFNALLKTLEEPPEHVKFIFATTEVNKIPITILSRCQRYDFAGIDAAAIQRRLAQIAEIEGVEVEADALAIIAMRAAGSMRDSQSLLEQLLATGKRQISAEDVTGLLGLAPAARLSQLVQPMLARDAAAALAALDAAIADGADVGLLIDQLLGYFRDAMTQAVGCPETQLLFVLPGQRDEIRAVAEQFGVETLLAVSQILDQTAARSRVSTQVRTLAEMAIVRICRLQDLDDLSALIEQLKSGAVAGPPGPVAAKKNGPPSPRPVPPQTAAAPIQPRALPGGNSPANGRHAPSEPQAASNPRPEAGATGESAAVALDEDTVESVWSQALNRLTGMVADSAAAANKLSVDSQGRLVASFPESHKFSRDSCQRPANLSRIEAAVAEVCGGRVPLVLAIHADPQAAAAAATPARPTHKQQQAEVAGTPFVQKAMELFDGDASKLRISAPGGES